MIVKLGMGIALALVGSVLFFSRDYGTEVSDAQLSVNAGALLLDVRTPGEYAAGHISNAVNIPVHELKVRHRELGSKDGRIVVYCRSGARSARSARILRDAGFTAVRDLGAMSNWRSDLARKPVP